MEDLGRSHNEEKSLLLQHRYDLLLDRFVRAERLDLALEVLKLKFSLHRVPCAVYELDDSDYLIDTDEFNTDTSAAYDMYQSFISKTAAEQSVGLHQKQLAVVGAVARIIAAEAILNSTDPEPWRGVLIQLLAEAQSIFASMDCRLGTMQASLLEFQLHNHNMRSSRKWSGIRLAFEEMDFVPGLVKWAQLDAAFDLTLPDLQAVNTSPRVRKQLLPLLKRSGNELEYRKAQLKSMTSWLQGPAFVLVCERTFHPHGGFQSASLALTASRILCQLYNTNNNFSDAYIFALLCLRYANSRESPILQRRATHLFLDALSNATAPMSDPGRIQELTNLAAIWDKWMYIKFKQFLARSQADQSFNWHEIDFETLLWPARTVASNIEENSSIQLQSRNLMLTLKASLDLACDLLLVAPLQLRSRYAASTLHAIGTAAEHMGNPMLALQLYDHSRAQWRQSQELIQAHGLEVQIARRLDSLLWMARPLFVDFLPICQAYLANAEAFFWGEVTMQSSYRNAMLASSVLARFHLRCVHYAIDDVNWGEDDAADTLRDDQKNAKSDLEYHCVQAEKSVKEAITGT